MPHPVDEAKYDAEQLRAMLAKGHAIKNEDGDPSYPIGDVEDLKKAIKAVGRGGGDHDKIRRYIIRRAKALKATNLLPDDWTTSGAKESLVVETATISEKAAASAKATGRMLVRFISPGWGSSGYYSPEVLEQAAADNVIPAGTHMYADHPTEAEDLERPVRSIKDLMAVTTEDARLGDDGALEGEVQVVPQWRELVETVKDSIGVSIRGSATDIVHGEAEGRKGGIIEGLVAPVMSVDFVTRAGRGGKVLSILESAAANRRAIEHGIAEATANDTREQLQSLLRDEYGTPYSEGKPGTYVWVRDFDADRVWFEIEGPDGTGLFEQSYTTSDDDRVTLGDDRTEVRVRTTYVPVNPAGRTTTEDDQEVTMGNIQIDEAEHSRLVETAGRVETLESERDSEKARADKAEAQLAERDRQARGRELVAEPAREAGVSFSEREVKGLLVDMTVAEDGKLDEEAFAKLVDEDAAAKKAAGGAGQVSGFGGDPTPVDEGVTPDLVDATIGEAFGHSRNGTKIKEA